MRFYYPNFTNDMWRIFGLCFFRDKMHFVRQELRTYNQEAIVNFLNEKGIALYDTATRIVRTRNTASDKDLQIVEPTNLKALLTRLPACRAVVTAGQLATTVCCEQFQAEEPKVGQFTTLQVNGQDLRLYRMPSSSRAYPMAVEKKAEFYEAVFRFVFP